jgi:two-component system nitrogen regulation response regulator NtrX
VAAQQAKVLVIDDERGVRDSLALILEYEGYEVVGASDGQRGLELLREEHPDLVFLDIKMPQRDGLEILPLLRQEDATLPVIVISGHGTIAQAVEATKLGAFDFLEKPLERDRVLLVARNALAQHRLVREVRTLKHDVEERYQMIGTSAALKKVWADIERAAPTQATVLIAGPSGTGKELVARAIHRRSKRADRPFVQVNCAAIPDDLIESELFGHEKGSFTGATERKSGKFQQADGGTIFLDEIGDMSIKVQAKVLRVLQEGEIERIGAGRTLQVDVRVIAATNHDLEQLVAEGRFREDLLFRLKVVPIRVPPLRERREDIPLLVEHFARLFIRDNNLKPKRFAPAVIERFQEMSWKGNVRELKNTVERMLILHDGDLIRASDLPAGNTGSAGTAGPLDSASHGTLQAFKDAAERAFLIEKLKENNYNILQTAKAIQTPRSNLYKKIKQYNIETHP